MKLIRNLFLCSMILLIASSVATASDFGWTRDFNIQAQADPSGLRARLATRFNLGDVQVKAVLSNFDSPADAYLALRLGEMSGRHTSYVIERYRQNQGRGWGVVAKSLGIKPGSAEFHALKRGHDLSGGHHSKKHTLYSNYDHRNGSYAESEHGKGENKGKGQKHWK